MQICFLIGLQSQFCLVSLLLFLWIAILIVHSYPVCRLRTAVAFNAFSTWLCCRRNIYIYIYILCHSLQVIVTDIVKLYTVVQKTSLFFLLLTFLQMLTNCYNNRRIVYLSNLRHKLLFSYPPHLRTAAALLRGKIKFYSSKKSAPAHGARRTISYGVWNSGSHSSRLRASE